MAANDRYSRKILPGDLDAALDGAEMTGHAYLSTGCLHGEHDYCKGNVGSNGAKIPGQCKFCGARCQCPCHQEQR